METVARKPYPTDLTDAQWVILEQLVPPGRHGGRPRTVDIREVVHTILHLNRTGSRWDMLPHDLLPKSTLYEYFSQWRDDGTWTMFVDALRRQVRIQEDRGPQAAFAGRYTGTAGGGLDHRGRRRRRCRRAEAPGPDHARGLPAAGGRFRRRQVSQSQPGGLAEGISSGLADRGVATVYLASASCGLLLSALPQGIAMLVWQGITILLFLHLGRQTPPESPSNPVQSPGPSSAQSWPLPRRLLCLAAAHGPGCLCPIIQNGYCVSRLSPSWGLGPRCAASVSDEGRSVVLVLSPQTNGAASCH